MLEKGYYFIGNLMRIDGKLVRELLLVTEEYFPFREREVVWPDGYTENEIDYHCIFLIDAGLMKGSYNRMAGGTFRVVVHHLTPYGHEYIEAIRDEGIFKKVQEKLSVNNLTAASVDLILQLGMKLVRQNVGLE